MSAVPLQGYEVEFIPLERRLLDRRSAPISAALPTGIQADRRNNGGRRIEDRSPQRKLKAVR
jgi:hypothetical protein